MQTQAPSTAAWAPGPREPALGPGELHVWLADVTDLPDGVTHSLSPMERARAARILDQRKGERWARSRGVLRDLLARYLETAPGALRFQTGVRGKPYLAVSGSALAFSVSHSAALAAIALAADGEVGIDVQAKSPQRDASRLARRAFGATAARRLQSAAPGARERAFVRMWVRHEAARKCAEEGIWAGGEPADRSGASAPRARWLHELELDSPAAAAVCWTRVPRELRCWTWTA
jgi:4'-phosphopantetheinyl transferase